jgi:acetyl esterase/lipase
MKLRVLISGMYMLSLAAPAATLAQQPQGASLEDPPWVKAVASKQLVYAIPGMDKVMVRGNRVYKRADTEELKADVYQPAGLTKGAKRPAVIFIHGGPLPRNLRTGPKDWNVFVSYGKLVAASGMIGVTFNHRLYGDWKSVANSESDLADLIAYLRSNADDLGIDGDRLTLWAFSGGGPLLSLAMHGPVPYIRCLVSYYSVLDLEQESKESDGTLPDQALADFSPLHQLERNDKGIAPMFIARMGQDFPGLNKALGLFLPVALTKNMNLTLSNDPEGHHGFDIEDNTEASREIIQRTLEFVKAHN